MKQLNEDTITFLEIVFPDATNHHGTLFGGYAVELMSKAAFVAATRYCRQPLVLAGTEKLNFYAPARQGQLLEIEARVQSKGRTSLKIKVDVWAEELISGERTLCVDGFFTMVAVDDKGRPVPVRAPKIKQ